MLATGGEAVFARYAFPPNDLGHCGPPGSEVLLAAGSGAAAGPDVAERAAAFDGAWPYLRLLAAVAGSGELDAAVVSAYWLGGGLVDQVDVDEFAATVLLDFAGQPGVADRLAAAPGLLTPGPSHAFHVFVVYPWVSLLGSGGDVPRRVLDSCRVRWGTVESVDGETLAVRARPLTWDGAALSLGEGQLQTARWSRDEHAFVTEPRPGDQVSLHWDWVCDRLDDAQVAAVATTTERQLWRVNRWLAAR